MGTGRARIFLTSGGGRRARRWWAQSEKGTHGWNGDAQRSTDGDVSGALNIWDAGDDDYNIPPREWLLGNTFCKKFLSLLIADGGVGKTALRIAQIASLVTGRSITGEHVFRRCRALILSFKDDRDLPLGQTLIVTTGLGWVREGGAIEEIRPGDVVWFAPGEKHWHGATPTTAMSHIAIQEKLNGSPVDWMEHVTDAQYRR